MIYEEHYIIMIPLTFAHQTITIFSELDTIIITVLLLILPVIIIESLIMKNYSRRTWWKLFKFSVIINVVASLAAIFLSFIGAVSPCYYGYTLLGCFISSNYWG